MIKEYEPEVLTKSKLSSKTLEKVDTRKGYSATPASPSSNDMSMCGLTVSSKLIPDGLFAYMRIRRGVDSPLPEVVSDSQRRAG